LLTDPTLIGAGDSHGVPDQDVLEYGEDGGNAQANESIDGDDAVVGDDVVVEDEPIDVYSVARDLLFSTDDTTVFYFAGTGDDTSGPTAASTYC